MECICKPGTVNVDCPTCEVDFPPTKEVVIDPDTARRLHKQGQRFARQIRKDAQAMFYPKGDRRCR